MGICRHVIIGGNGGQVVDRRACVNRQRGVRGAASLVSKVMVTFDGATQLYQTELMGVELPA